MFAPYDTALLLTLLALLALALSLATPDLSRALFLAVVYIFGTFHCCVLLRARNPHWLLFALAVVWAGDAAAYHSGRAFGRHKLAPRVSPAKSRERSAASLLASAAFAARGRGPGPTCPAPSPPSPCPGSSPWPSPPTSPAKLGDLAESARNRGASLKDSGAMLPGHGDWLDRVDSSLFTLPVVWAFLSWAAI